MKLSKRQRDKLWGEAGPYSEAWLTIEKRILDDFVSRVFINVEVHINPFTYEVIKKNRDLFANDEMLQQLLDHSEFQGQSFGYVSCAFQGEYINENVMKEAKKHLDYAEKTIIKMHKFVLHSLNTSGTKSN
ncbi:MAG TPA: hypothetical protein VMR77_01920 [Patescibacteria group bacterium]|jgi:hypothetical protein|nr:hypothetical protein [Patescibacteria group bacterium]